MKQHFRLDTHPLADPANVVQGDRYRITVLDAGLVRLEYDESGRFEDRASQTVVNRAFPATDFKVTEKDGLLEIHTERLHLIYDKGPFTTHGLSVQAKGGYHSNDSVWRFGTTTPNLGGTARTLDDIDGAIPLEDGVLAFNGVAVVDDSRTVLLEDDGWIAERHPGTLDLYVFSFGRDYKAALKSLYTLTGPTPLLPRYALGNWWSRYHPYTADEYVDLVDRFRAERVPLSVAVIDMDWHWVDIDPRHGSGWTGYTWNTDLFPDPKQFLADLHDRGLATSLNVHPAEGVHAHETAYAAIAERMGIDPDDELPVSFDPTDPEFIEAYFEELHHPLEDEGVDFWWLDWQQGGVTKVAGPGPAVAAQPLPLPRLGPGRPAPADVLALRRHRQPPLPDRLLRRHAHHLGVAGLPAVLHRDRVQRRLRLVEPRHRRPLQGLPRRRAHHPVGAARRLLAGQPAALRPQPVQHQGAVAVLGGRRAGDDRLPAAAAPAAAVPRDDEPPRARRGRADRAADVLRPPRRGRGVRRTQPVHVRQRAARRADHDSPADRDTGLGRVKAWLPEGTWTDVFTGQTYTGGRSLYLHRDLTSIPVLAKAGAIVPHAAAGRAARRDRPAVGRRAEGVPGCRRRASPSPRTTTTTAGR